MTHRRSGLDAFEPRGRDDTPQRDTPMLAFILFCAWCLGATVAIHLAHARCARDKEAQHYAMVAAEAAELSKRIGRPVEVMR